MRREDAKVPGGTHSERDEETGHHHQMGEKMEGGGGGGSERERESRGEKQTYNTGAPTWELYVL